MGDPTVADLLREGQEVDLLDRQVLLAEAAGRSRAWLLAHGEQWLDPAVVERYQDWLQRRRQHEPLAYILGYREFWSMKLRVTPDTLIPRPETELMVETALALIPPERPGSVLDLGTGSGAIALAIASERPRAHIIATDQSAAALEVARANARRLGLDRVKFVQSSWYEAVPGQRFELTCANPPYVASNSPYLDNPELQHEPRSALVAGDDGLDDIRIIFHGLASHLRQGGSLLLEHGFDQRDAILGIVPPGFQCRFIDDLAGQPRLVQLTQV